MEKKLLQVLQEDKQINAFTKKYGCNYCTLAVSLSSRYIADSPCAGTKIIPDTASVHT